MLPGAASARTASPARQRGGERRLAPGAQDGHVDVVGPEIVRQRGEAQPRGQFDAVGAGIGDAGAGTRLNSRRKKS